jgi:rhamnosyltransferase subunit B
LVGHDPLNRPTDLCGKNVIAVPYAPYAQIFPRASAIVHQGGIGTTGQALRAGKPMLVVPYGGDQFDNGARVERLGVGHTIRRNQYQADRVAVVLRQLLESPTYPQQAAMVGQQLQQERGVQVACDAIEKLLPAKQAEITQPGQSPVGPKDFAG